MTAAGHLAAALVLRARYRRAPLAMLLLAAVLPDVLWAALNLAHLPGAAPFEISRVSVPFRGLGDATFLRQPWSHSLLATALLALAFSLVALAVSGERAARLARIVPTPGSIHAEVAWPAMLAVLAHWFLDALVHDRDLTVWPDGPSIGPALALDALAPAHGISATRPVWAFALQSALLLAAALVYAHSCSRAPLSVRLRFVAGCALTALLALPPFLGTWPMGRIGSGSALAAATLADIAVSGLALYALGSWLERGPPRAAADEALQVRGLARAAGLLCGALAGLYLAQAILDAPARPGTNAWSLLLALTYLGAARVLFRFNPSALWLVLALTAVAAPLGHALLAPGSLAFPQAALEACTAVVCGYLVVHLLRSDLVL